MANNKRPAARGRSRAPAKRAKSRRAATTPVRAAKSTRKGALPRSAASAPSKQRKPAEQLEKTASRVEEKVEKLPGTLPVPIATFYF